MKRFILLLCAGLLLLPSCGRQPAPREPAPGWYVSEKDPMGAYIILNEDGTWASGRGMVISHRIGGAYRIENSFVLAGSGPDKVRMELGGIGDGRMEAASVEWKQEGVSFWIEPGDTFRIWDPSTDPLSLAVCSADDGLALARKYDLVVMEGMKCTSGRETWDEFVGAVNRGESASVLCVRYYVIDRESMSEELYEEEKDQYPKLFFQRVEYDGNSFTVTSRPSTETEPDHTESFSCLCHYTGEAPPTARFTDYEFFVLTDDPEITWDEIERGMYSSQSGDRIRHFTVFSDISGMK